MEKFEIKDRLCQYLNSIDLSVNKLEEMCGFSTRYINNSNYTLPKKKIDIILTFLPELNGEWLIYGRGEMLNNNFSEKKSDETQLPYFRKGVLDRIEKIFQREGYDVEAYESNHKLIIKGTFARCRKRGGHDEIWSWIKTIIREYPRYSPSWLIYGEGDMLRQDSRTVPVYGITELMHLPNLERKPVEHLTNIYPNADCMVSITEIANCEIPSDFTKSDILACKLIDTKKDDSRLLLNSSFHLIVTDNGTAWIRRIEDKGDEIHLIGLTQEKGIDIEKSYILEIFEVVGYIRYL